METKKRDRSGELFVDPRDVRFWEKEGEKYRDLYWVRAMLSEEVEPPPLPTYAVGQVVLKREEKASLYRLLAQGFTEPTEALVKSLAQGTFLNSTHYPLLTIHSLISQLKSRDPAFLLDSLQKEYTRIFLDSYMPFIPPYESIYRGERRVMGEAANKVAGYYKRFGLVAAEEMPDHISHECEFIVILYEKNELALAKEFLREHLLDWGPKLCYDLKSLAKGGFYEAIALIGNALFSLEAKEKR